MSSVVVIGSGVIGLATAVYAAGKGFSVTVIDRSAESHPGCSHGNAGMIVPSHFVPLAAPGAAALGLKWMWNPESPFWIRPRLDRELLDWGWKFWKASNAQQVRRAAPVLRDLHLASRACFEEFANAAGNEFGLVKRGLLALCKTAHAWEEEALIIPKAKELGIPAQALSAAETAKLDPGITMDIAGSVYFPMDCHLDPGRFMKRLKQLAIEAGVRFQFETEATGAIREGNRLRALQTNRGEISSDQFALCAGSWSAKLGRSLGLALPMQAGKGYSLTLENPPQLPEICSILAEARVAVTPMGKALRVGGTMEIAGLNEEINPARVAGILKAVPKYFPAFSADQFKAVKPWSGLRPVSPDGLPYLGRSGSVRNLVVATGHSMMGLSLGPISGKLTAGILAGEKPAIDLDLLNPDRYS
jgi:D-amino-acid dehydrogenase